MDYEALFYNGWVDPPGYFLIDSVEGETPEQALMANLDEITAKIREMFSMDEKDSSDEKLQSDIYVLRENGLVSARNAQRIV